MDDKEIMNHWIDIISKMYTNLHNTQRVLHSSSVSDKKRDRLIKYFNRLEEIHRRVSESKYKSDEKLLKSFYYDLYVIKPEDIPESYFQNQVRLARERGYGNLEITPDIRRQMIDEVIQDQKSSLDKWIEYFLYDEESKSYEMWEKYWVFQGLQSLGKYDKETGKFSKRDKHTVYPFPPVEREYIFTTLKLMEDYIKNKESDEEIKSALGSGNFKLLYEYVIKQSFLKGQHQSNTTSGKWIKYNQGSDYNVLRNSLQGYYTGWCTAAGEKFAKDQLAGGDFYVYYTFDENGEAKVPRIAIRMDGKNKIGEIRGIAKDQNIEPEMVPILDEKLKEFPDRDKYLKKEHDMKLLTLIDKKASNNLELTIEELRFLYEIDGKIDGFGFNEDPRIAEIRGKRDKKKDYAYLFNVNEDEITSSSVEWEQNPTRIKVFIGDLNLNDLTNVEDLILPKAIVGNLYIWNLTRARNLILPQNISESLFLSSLTSAEGLTFPQSVGKVLNLDSLISAEGVVLPQNVGWHLLLGKLKNAKGLVFPKNVGGYLYFESLTSAEGLVLPQNVGGNIYFNNLTSAEGLVLPRNIGGNIFLKHLKNAEGLVLPYGFDLDKLICPVDIKREIMNNPEKYYMTMPIDENNRRR